VTPRGRPLCWGILVLAGVAIGGVTLRAAERGCFNGLPEVRSCLGLSTVEGFYDPRPIEPGSVVFLGDSITAGGPWDRLFPTTPLRNRGVNADQSSGVRERSGAIAAARPGKIFLLIGTNDLHRGHSIDAIASRVAATLTTIQSRSPWTRVYLQSVLPRAGVAPARVLALNRALHDVALRGGADWIDLYPAFLDSAGRSIRPDLTSDGLHLSPEGYRVWRDAIAHAVEARPRPSASERSPAR